jgi:hypothetical protein
MELRTTKWAARTFCLTSVLFAATLLSLWGCGRSRATQPLPTPTPTMLLVAELKATAQPTPVPSATPTPAPVRLWIHPAVPSPVREAVLAANNTVELGNDQAVLEASLAPAAHSTGLEYVLAPVVPFASLVDGISWEGIRQFWLGQPTDDEFLAKSPTLFVSEEVKALLTALLGEPSPQAPITVAPPEALVDLLWESRPSSWAIVPFDSLEPRLKVLSLDGVSVLERGLAGKPYPLRIQFEVSGPRARELKVPQFTNRDEERMTILVMTGVTALVRGTAVRMERNGILYPAEHIADVLRSADITHISNEIPFAQNCPPPRGDQESLVFCSDPKYIELLRFIGTDVVELTGNHFEDYGPEATILTVQMYDQEGWLHYGGGVDLDDARRPVIISDHGNTISFIGCNPVGPEYAWAGEDYPGAAPCDFDYMHAQLQELAEKVDVPIATWQYWEFYHYEPTPQQQEDFRGMVDAGAKIVSGSQAHHPQAFEFYNGGFIHYGLGNLFFDQMWSLGTRQECIDRHIIYKGKHIATEVLTYMLEDYSQPRPMTPEERQELLQALFAASGW